MFKFIKNKFLFIVLISVLTLVVLVVGALSLYQDNSSVFANDGYILETTTKTNNLYYFSADTKYKENVDEQITFSDKDSNKVAVDPASFVHYSNGDVAFLKKGALVNLEELTSAMVSYYNITSESTINYENNAYSVTSNGKKISIESFIGRISDSKYIIAGKDLSLKIPNSDETITGDYFEILFIEEGIVKIDNKEVSHQVTAQDTYLYVGENITINLGDGKIFYDGEAKMLLSQITINGDENIDLDVDEEKAGGGGGSGEGSGGSGEGTGEGDGFEEDDGLADGTGEGDGTGTGTGTGTGDGTGGTGGTGEGGDATAATPQVELIEAVVTSTTLDLSMQLNNAKLATGNIVAYLTNVSTGKKESPQSIPLANGTFQLSYGSLIPATEYALSIVEVGIESEKQYFQKSFKTKDLGVSLEKVYAMEDSLAYNIVFDENTDVSQVRISIYENNGTNSAISPNEFTISKDDLDSSVIFSGLKSNRSYSVSIDTVWINNTVYSNLYSINRIDTTLKKKPSISGIKVDANAEEVKFNIALENVKDSDESIVSYVYEIYLADDITVDNLDPEVVYSVTKNDSDDLVLNLNEIDELKTGVDYRCKIIAQYHDNEMMREVATDYSNNFLIKSKPNVSFELTDASINSITGVISLIDANCTVPIAGRMCMNQKNNFTLRYYKLKEEETTENDTIINFDPTKLTSNITLSGLSSNTTYAVKVFGSYYDDDNVLHSNVQIGSTFYVTTDKSDNLHFEIVGDNESGKNKDGTENTANVVTFDARLTAPQNSDAQEQISTITLNLYSGRYNVKEKLIGTYVMKSRSEIDDFFSNLTIKNSLFTDVSGAGGGKIDSLLKMLNATNYSDGTDDGEDTKKKLNNYYTVEVEDVYDSTGKNKFIVENNVYTFKLTASYFLDSRIELNKKDTTYVTVTEITKGQLTEDEYTELSKTVKNLDDLNDDTVVGVIVENSLSDLLVDSAFEYEKANVYYTVYNSTMSQDILSVVSEMGNKYQPKEKTIWLDSSELDDGKNYFTRGYDYKIGFHIEFITEDGSNPVYKNDALYKNLSIERQAPSYSQYIKTSSSTSVTYRYRFKDVDNALYKKGIYYTLGSDDSKLEVKESIKVDDDFHDIVIPIDTNTNYELFYKRKNTSYKNGEKEKEYDYVTLAKYRFDQEYVYNDEISYEILENSGNVLSIRLENNDFTSRTAAYKVVIQSKDSSSIADYTRYFLASKLDTLTMSTGVFDEEGNEIQNTYKYIAIDYANISRFIGHEVLVYVYAYYDNGLVGIEQPFKNGLILEETINNKYLNTYNGAFDSSNNAEPSYSKLDTEIMGIQFIKEAYNKEESTIYLYNQLWLNYEKGVYSYNPLIGSSYYGTTDLPSHVGIKYGISFSNVGMIFTDVTKTYSGIQARSLSEANLKTNDNTFKFNTIIPTIKVTTGSNTINSIKINMEARGVYGDDIFTKDGKVHNKIYVEFYSDVDATNKLDTLTTNITISGDDNSGYSAVIDELQYKNLVPATTYYFRIYAYVDGVYTRLFDGDTTADTLMSSYVAKDYSTSTLNAKELLSKVDFEVEPVAYGEYSSKKQLTWLLKLNSSLNYKIRFELYEPNGTTTSIDPETGEEVVTPLYKAVNFDGTTPDSCDNTVLGVSSNGYVNGCYIAVDQTYVGTINNHNQVYSFTGDDFVFGDGYYRLLIYAIPYTNDAYKEEDKLLLYQNDKLSTVNLGQSGLIDVSALNEVTFKINEVSGGYCVSSTSTAYKTDPTLPLCDKTYDYNYGYYVTFKPNATDSDYVMRGGNYTIKLKDEKGNLVGVDNGDDSCVYYVNGVKNEADNCEITLKNNSINSKVDFTGLDSNTLYYIELSSNIYRNNVGYTEEQKTSITPFTDFVYTPIAAGITLGTITATQSSTKSIILTYNGADNLSNNIVEVDYTISLKGGSSKTTGSYVSPDIFSVSTDLTPKLTIDVSDSSHSTNTSFTFKYGNTYIITTKYYYLDSNGVKQILKDQENGKDTFTTILNL